MAGYKIREQNWRCSIGELDIVCEDKEVLVFVEVKTSAKRGVIPPEQRVNAAKQRKLRSLAKFYLKHVRRADMGCRFDVVAVWWEEAKVRVRHVRDAF